MSQIINPNDINDYPLNIQMKGDPGSSPTLIPASYFIADNENIKPNINDTAISNVELSKLKPLFVVSHTKNTIGEEPYDISTAFLWRSNENTKGKISPTKFDIYPEGKNYNFTNAGGTYNIIVENDIYSTIVPTSNTKGVRAFNNIYLSGKVKTDDGEVDINIDRDGNPIYLSGLLAEEDEEWDSEVKTTLGINSNDGIIGQEPMNYPEPNIGISFTSNSNWVTTYYSSVIGASYLWGQQFVTEKVPYATEKTDYSKITLTLSPNTPSSKKGTVSGTLATQVVSSNITYDGGTVKIRVGNTKDSSGNVTGFTFTEADNSQSIVESRTAVISYSYTTYFTDSKFDGTGAFTITQEGGNTTTPNPSITYLFGQTSNCTLSKTEQGPQFKDGPVGEVEVTVNPNKATKGVISFGYGTYISLKYGDYELGRIQKIISDSDAAYTSKYPYNETLDRRINNIDPNGGTYIFTLSDPTTIKYPSSSASRTVSFNNYVTMFNESDSSKINNNSLVWSTTQDGQMIGNSCINVSYNWCNEMICTIHNMPTKWYILGNDKPKLSVIMKIPSNIGESIGGTTNPFINVDNNGKSITVPDATNDAEPTITVTLTYADGVNYKIPMVIEGSDPYNWTPGSTAKTSERTFTIGLSNITADSDSTVLNLTYAPLGKDFVMTQLGADPIENDYTPVTISANLPTYANNNSVTSVTLENPTVSKSLQFTFPKAIQPERNGFDMTLTEDDDYAVIDLNYTDPENTFDSDTSNLSITAGKLSMNKLEFTRPAVYPDYVFKFKSDNPGFVSYNGLSEWEETFTYDDNGGKTNKWTIDKSKINVRYTNVINISGSLDGVKDGNNAFTSNNITISTKATGSTADVSAIITATDQDGNENSVTFTKSGVNAVGITYTYTSSDPHWIINRMYYNNALTTYILTGAIRGVDTTTPTSTTITITAKSRYDNTITTSWPMYACRRGVVPCTVTDENSTIQWVNVEKTNNDGTTTYDISYTYSIPTGLKLSCTVNNASIDYWTTSGSVSCNSISEFVKADDPYNVIISANVTQKKQQRTGSYNAIYDCAGNVEISSYEYGDWVDVEDENGNPVTQSVSYADYTGPTTAAGTLYTTYSLDGGINWDVSSLSTVTKTLTPDNCGNSESTTGDKKYAYFKAMLVYNNVCLGYSTQHNAYVNKYGITYHNE